MSKSRACPECYAVIGHWSWCVGKGYAHTGPHPDSPDAAEPETERHPSNADDLCCGGTCVRRLCTYHGPGALPKGARGCACADLIAGDISKRRDWNHGANECASPYGEGFAIRAREDWR